MVLIQKLNQYKETSGLTNQQIADKSGVPVGTVNRIMAGQTEEPSFSTIAKIVKATGGSLDEIIGIEPKTVTITETKIVQADERLISVYEKTIADKNRWITLLFVVFIAVLVAIGFLFIYDFTHPDRGWYQAMGNYTNGNLTAFLQKIHAWLQSL